MRRPLPLLLALWASLTAAPAVGAQADPSFGDGGYVVVGLGDGPSGVEAVALGAGGAVYAVGDDESSDDGSRFAVVRLRPDGAPDPAFGDAGAAFVRARPSGVHLPADLVVLADGSVVVAGDVNREAFTARLTPGGVPDPAYGRGGVSDVLFEGDAAGALALADGAVLVAGTELVPRGVGLVLARVDAEGRLDRAFGDGGLVVVPSPERERYTVSGLAAAPGGRVVVVGDVADRDGRRDVFAARFSLDGVPDETFGTGGVARADVGAADLAGPVAVRPDGRVVVGGRDFGGTPFVVQFAPDGALDAGFGDGGLLTLGVGEGDSTVRALGLLPDGRVLLTGAVRGPSVAGSSAESSLYVARLTAAGELDPTFGAGGLVEAEFPLGSYSDGRALAVSLATGAVLAAGRALSADAGTGFAFVRLLPDARSTAAVPRPGFGSPLRVVPNPSAAPAALHYDGRPLPDARVAVYDARGREVAVVHAGFLAPRSTLALPRLRPGAYVVRVSATGGTWAWPFVVAR